MIGHDRVVMLFQLTGVNSNARKLSAYHKYI